MIQSQSGFGGTEMQDVYERCPTFENDQYRIRLLSKEDAADLLNMYSDEKTISLCNSDNCSGGFHFTTMDVMRDVIKWWQEEYARRGFVRLFYAWDSVGKITLSSSKASKPEPFTNSVQSSSLNAETV